MILDEVNMESRNESLGTNMESCSTAFKWLIKRLTWSISGAKQNKWESKSWIVLIVNFKTSTVQKKIFWNAAEILVDLLKSDS